METDEDCFDLEYFNSLVGENLVDMILTKAPTKVKWRVIKAADHVRKAHRIKDIDMEMFSIRLIAAEEELVVAVFEWLKLNTDKMPEHKDLVGKFKNHQVKLMFTPVLMLMKSVLIESLGPNLNIHGVRVELKPRFENEKVDLCFSIPSSGFMMPLNPLSIFINLEEQEQEQDIIESLYEQLQNEVRNEFGIPLKEFVMKRADFRNLLLYSNDGGFVNCVIDYDELMDGFNQTFEALLWSLAALLTNDPLSPNLGLVTQFIDVYRLVLIKTKVLKG
ncbi:TPA: hypothetical protein ACOJ3T_004234 [Klebsiella pneumoniae]|uniref:hypothetical protein n=1 Tax=Klebsiella pneumoniae TaxID=573 RepID=UPI001BCAE697|nr:hypothetical protein [Klebsiella pneumoniae]MDM7296926.1 hypothetical protein [Klebsiella pneumoniae]UBM92586.1 hypothetical protein LB478_04260 [Klebsiella pneumoniae]HBR1547139.1 hypothetical protein [Klebsiella pneumoniae]HCA9573287.1 hypothetical protein [Klebsiella pneumoniae]HCB1013571.1 hypothetical protein [Klebsiella pneumoniae]